MYKEHCTTAMLLFEKIHNTSERFAHILPIGPERLQPVPPDESRTWNLVASTATASHLLWFWERTISGEGKLIDA